MSTIDVGVEALEVSAYAVPTETERESDGTLTWDSTDLVVVEAHADGHTGVGYTYCHPAAAKVIAEKLASAVLGADALMPQRAWAQMHVQARQLGHAAITEMAISAVDIALWDLKARLLGVCLADALPRYRESVPIYGSGGFCNYDLGRLSEQLRGWGEQGFGAVKIKVGRDKHADMKRAGVARRAIGDEVELLVDANGAYAPKEALDWAERFAAELRVAYLEEPVSSDDLDGLALVREHGPAGLAVAAGEYGWNLPYFQRMLDAGAVDVLQADVSRCGGVTNFLRVDALCKARSLPFSAHCVPAVSAHAGCAMETLMHCEYFFDHYRIEAMLFEGAPAPHRGHLAPDRARPGLGLELRGADAEPYETYRGRAS